MTQQLGQAFPVLEEAARTYAPPDVLAPVLRDLLFDGISVRNLYRIMELLLRHETVQALARFPDPIAFVRTGLADVIAHKFAVETDETLLAYLVDPEIEDAIASYWDGSEPAGGEEPLPERLSAAVRAELSGLRTSSHIPAILSRDELRRPLRALLRHEFPRIPILAYGDLPPSYNVQPVARISWA
jgi:flagellar biosynthesis component FlhA